MAVALAGWQCLLVGLMVGILVSLKVGILVGLEGVPLAGGLRLSVGTLGTGAWVLCHSCNANACRVYVRFQHPKRQHN
jgi:hypothetical protein